MGKTGAQCAAVHLRLPGHAARVFRTGANRSGAFTRWRSPARGGRTSPQGETNVRRVTTHHEASYHARGTLPPPGAGRLALQRACVAQSHWAEEVQCEAWSWARRSSGGRGVFCDQLPCAQLCKARLRRARPPLGPDENEPYVAGGPESNSRSESPVIGALSPDPVPPTPAVWPRRAG